MPSSSNRTLSRSEQYEIIEEVSECLHIHPIIPKMLFKFVFGDKTIDEKFFSDIAKLIDSYVFNGTTEIIHSGII